MFQTKVVLSPKPSLPSVSHFCDTTIHPDAQTKILGIILNCPFSLAPISSRSPHPANFHSLIPVKTPISFYLQDITQMQANFIPCLDSCNSLPVGLPTSILAIPPTHCQHCSQQCLLGNINEIDLVATENAPTLRMKYKIKNNKLIITAIERGTE